MVTTYEFENLLMSFELTLGTPYMTRISAAVRSGDLFPYWPQCGERVEIYGSEGVMYIGPHGTGWQIFGRPRHEQATLIDRFWGKPVDLDHQANFIACVRSRKTPRRGRGRGPSQRAASALCQHELSGRGTKAASRCQDRGSRFARSDEGFPPRISPAVGGGVDCMLNIAILGAGTISDSHIAAYLKRPGQGPRRRAG